MIFILFEAGTPEGKGWSHKSIVDMATIKPESWVFSMRPFGSVIKCVNVDSQSNCSSNCCFYSLSSLTEILRAVLTATALLLETYDWTKPKQKRPAARHVESQKRIVTLVFLCRSPVCLDYLYSWCRIKPCMIALWPSIRRHAVPKWYDCSLGIVVIS